MPSSWSASLRFELQFTGENVNLWGDKLNAVLQHADYAVAGWLTKALVGDYTLTTANAADDEARTAMLKFTGSGPFSVTIPSVSKAYDVWNACSAALTVTTGGGTTATLAVGERIRLTCDGANVYRPAIYSLANALAMGGYKITLLADPTSAQDAATKQYADNLAFTANAGILPGQTGNAGKMLTTDGATASWHQLTISDLSNYVSDQAAKTTAATALAVAFAVAL